MMRHFLLFWILLSPLASPSLHAAPSQQIPQLSPKARELFITQEFKLKSQAGPSYRIYLAISRAALRARGIPVSTLPSTLSTLSASLASTLARPAPLPYQALAAKNGIFYTLDGNGFFPRLLNAVAWDSTLAPENMPIIIGHEFSGAWGGGSPQEWWAGGSGARPPAWDGSGARPPDSGVGPISRGLDALRPRSIRAQILLTLGELEDPAKKTPAKPPATRPLSLEEVVATLKGAAAHPGLVDFVEFKNRGHGDSAPLALLLGLRKIMGE